MKSAYLTIDDVPSGDFIPKVEYLHLHHIPALFFCVGKSIPGNELSIQYAVERGFLIGNHSFRHPYFSDLSIEDCCQEILKTDQLIDDIYRKAHLPRPAKYFRFPYFDIGGDISGMAYEAKKKKPPAERFKYNRNDKRKKLQQFLHDLGYRQPAFEGINPEFLKDPSILEGIDVRCTFDQAEYWLHEANAPDGLSEEENILARIDENFPYDGCSLNCENTADIILLHDQEKTTDLFFRIIDRYQEKGIQFRQIP
jgi:peptidoglycan/xylan/chitin deacetylase (PgdA/CDA1 family)